MHHNEQWGGSFTLVSTDATNGISSSAIVYFQNTTGSTLSLNINWSVTGDDELYFDRLFWYTGETKPSLWINGPVGFGQYQLNTSLNQGDNTNSKISNTPISTIGWNNFNGMSYTNNSAGLPPGNGTQTISVSAGNWVAIIIASDRFSSGSVNNTFNITGFIASPAPPAPKEDDKLLKKIICAVFLFLISDDSQQQRIINFLKKFLK